MIMGLKLNKSVLAIGLTATVISGAIIYQSGAENRALEKQQTLRDNARQEHKINEVILRDLANFERFVGKVSSEVELILLSETGEYVPRLDNGKWGPFHATLETPITYEVAIILPVNAIEITLVDGTVIIRYDNRAFDVAFKQFDWNLGATKKGFLSAGYSKEDVAALISVAQDQLKAGFLQGTEYIIQTENSLEDYFRQQAKMFGFNQVAFQTR